MGHRFQNCLIICKRISFDVYVLTERTRYLIRVKFGISDNILLLAPLDLKI